ncbi:MAG: sigma-70 family RNA polymerase sigma factor [Bacteroidota bacterium]
MSIFQRKNIVAYSDEQLIKEIECGNEAAFNLLYERYSNKLFRYFFRLLGNDRAKAEDFLQELFIKVLNNAHTFSSTQKASTWLYTIATNMCKNEWRNTENRQRLMRQFEAWEHQSKNALDKLQSQHLARILDKMMSQLEEEERLVLQLRFQQELSIKEIAAIINIPEGTVKSKLFYLLKRIAKQLKTNPML